MIPRFFQRQRDPRPRRCHSCYRIHRRRIRHRHYRRLVDIFVVETEGLYLFICVCPSVRTVSFSLCRAHDTYPACQVAGNLALRDHWTRDEETGERDGRISWRRRRQRQRRDHVSSSRSISPMIQADDAGISATSAVTRRARGRPPLLLRFDRCAVTRAYSRRAICIRTCSTTAARRAAAAPVRTSWSGGGASETLT